MIVKPVMFDLLAFQIFAFAKPTKHERSFRR